jgi:4-amino-4-deoxy-L-arabinose transferase-like glycosyltransferase
MHVVFCLLGAASCLLTYLLARELLPRATARVAGLLAAVYLPHVYFATRFDSENLFVPCLGLGMWMFVLHLKRGSVSWLLLSGLAFGAGALTRPFVLLLVPLLGLLLLFRSGTGFRRRLWVAASFTISFLVPVLPWTARNWMVHGKPVLIATNGGSTFYGSNNTIVATDWQLLGAWVSTTKLPGRDAIDATPNEIAHDALEWRLGIEWVRDHPSLMPQLVAAKFVRLWLPDVESANRKYVLLQLLTYTPFLLLILAGLWGIWRSSAYYNSPWLAIHLTILATVVTGLLFWGSPRFRDANTPLLMMYAAVGAQAFVLARRRTALANPAEVHAGVN